MAVVNSEIIVVAIAMGIGSGTFLNPFPLFAFFGDDGLFMSSRT